MLWQNRMQETKKSVTSSWKIRALRIFSLKKKIESTVFKFLRTGYF